MERPRSQELYSIRKLRRKWEFRETKDGKPWERNDNKMWGPRAAALSRKPAGTENSGQALGWDRS